MGLLIARRGALAAGAAPSAPDPGPGDFTPGDLEDLQAWYAADTLTLDDTDPVAQWDDLSGNGLHLVQATSGKQPEFRTGLLNGLPGVRFDGDFLRRASWTNTAVPNTIVVVARANIAISSTACMFGGQTSSQGSHQLLGFNSGGFKWTMFNGTIRADGDVDTDPHLFVASFTGSSSDRLRVDGADTGIAASAGTRSLASNVTVGSDATDVQPWPGDIFDVLVVSDQLTAQERDDVEAYYLTKYGL